MRGGALGLLVAMEPRMPNPVAAPATVAPSTDGYWLTEMPTRPRPRMLTNMPTPESLRSSDPTPSPMASPPARPADTEPVEMWMMCLPGTLVVSSNMPTPAKGRSAAVMATG